MTSNNQLVTSDGHIVAVIDGNLKVKSCINCDYWSKETSICGKYAQTPPADVIAKSCPAWLQDIPF